MEEMDIQTFRILFDKATKEFLEDNLTADFGNYFIENYSKCIQSWAYGICSVD